MDINIRFVSVNLTLETLASLGVTDVHQKETFSCTYRYPLKVLMYQLVYGIAMIESKNLGFSSDLWSSASSAKGVSQFNHCVLL